MRSLQERGDTIVEVIIAIAVISLVLVAAFQTTGYNTRATQATQERGEALKLAESQLEYLHAVQVLDTTASDCFTTGAVPSATIDDCNITPNGPGTDPEFKVRVTKAVSTYRVSVTWLGLNNVDESLTMYYRPTEVTP